MPPHVRIMTCGVISFPCRSKVSRSQPQGTSEPLEHAQLKYLNGGKYDEKSEMCSSKPVWAKYLVQSGLYYEGTVTECELEKVLELHKRDTVTMFGTRSSRRDVLAKKGSRARQTDENTGYTANVVTESGNGEKKKTQ